MRRSFAKVFRARAWPLRSAWVCVGAAQCVALAVPPEVVAALAAQPDPKPAESTAPPTAPDGGVGERLTAAELDDLLAPIALYPDVLLSAVLAASIYPEQVIAAGMFVRNGATPAQLEAQSWEDPVKAVAMVPEVITMMVAYPDWMRAIGGAFLVQAWDVMDSIQRLRGVAFDNGVLQTTPQQVVSVVQETQKIVIVPANPTVIYVPRYNPSVVFVRDDRAAARAGFIGFGAGIVVGAIIWGGSCNWNGGFIAWGRGGGWGVWGAPGGWHRSTRVNVNINVNNNNNRTVNINRPGFDRPGVNRPGGNQPITRLPETRNRIGQEGARWTPDMSRSGGQPAGDRLAQWRANNPGSRPDRSVITVPNRTRVPVPGAGNRPGGATRPDVPAPERPSTFPATRAPSVPSTRPAAVPTRRPATIPATRPPALPDRGTRPGGVTRPQTLPANRPDPRNFPSLGAAGGNRPSAFSGAAAGNRGAGAPAGGAARRAGSR